MPKINVNGVTLAYEVFGEGSPFVWTPGGWLPREEGAYFLAGRLSANYKVLIWDRRNSGASDFAIEDAPSEYHLWADDLHHLLNALNMSPAYIGGGSGGSVFSLFMAHRYPEDVKGIILVSTPSSDPGLIKPIVDAYCFKPAEVAEEKGMEAVIEHSTQAWVRVVSSKPEQFDSLMNWVAQTILLNPGNRERVLALDPEKFAAILRKWGERTLSGRIHLSGLSDEEVGRITSPTLIVPGFNPVHPREMAEILHGLLPNSEWVELSDRHPQEEVDEAQGEGGLQTQRLRLHLPFYEEFLQKNESK